MDLDTQIYAVAQRLSIGSHRLDGAAHLLSMRLEKGNISRLVQEGRQVSHRRKATALGLQAPTDKLLFGMPKNMVVDPRLVSAFAA